MGATPSRLTGWNAVNVFAFNVVSERVTFAFQEQIELAVKYNADYMVAETIHYYGEARIALDAIKKYGKGKKILPPSLF